MPGGGLGPIGRRPIGHILDLPLPSVSIAAAVAAGYLFTVEIYPAVGTPIYAATEQYNTLSTDNLANQPFNGTVEDALTFKRSIIDGGIGRVSSGYGKLSLHNSSGEYDSYASVALDGAHVVVRMVLRGGSFNNAVRLYDGIAQGNAEIDEELFSLKLFDDNAKLDIPVQPSVYGGTGGIDGDANVKGKRKQLVLGAAPNVTLLLIDAPNLVYQGHDGAVLGFAHVYDRAVELTVNATADYADYASLIAATITPGRWASCKALGIIRLGAKPDGAITATFSGAAVNNGLVAGAGASGAALTDTFSLAHYLITISTANVVVDLGSVTTAKAAQGAAIAYVVGPDESKTLRQALDELMTGVLGWASFRRDRSFEFGLFALPTATALGDYTDKDFFELKKLPLPDDMDPPPYRIAAAYSRNFTQQTDIDATVDASTQTLRKDKYSIAYSNNASLTATIQAAHPQSKDPAVIESWFVNSADAIAFCNAVLTLKGAAARALYQGRMFADAYGLNIGNTVQFTDDRFGLTSAKLLTLVSIDDNTSEEEVVFQGFG